MTANPAPGTPRHFLEIKDLSSETLRGLLAQAARLKAARDAGVSVRPLPYSQLGMVFEKNSTRTRISFEVAINELGGNALFLSRNDLQLGRGEPVSDTAKVMSRYLDAIMIRCLKHETLLEMARHAAIPVINGLTDRSHPCQIMADILTFEEHKGPIQGRTVAWIGDGNNVANSWVQAAARFGFALNLACPKPYHPCSEDFAWAKAQGANLKLTDDVAEAARGADLVTTDTWVSMGAEDVEARKAALSPFQVNRALMDQAAEGAIFMHCLPAVRGEEVTAEVIDGPGSVILDEAENRLHVQKSILLWCLTGRTDHGN